MLTLWGKSDTSKIPSFIPYTLLDIPYTKGDTTE